MQARELVRRNARFRVARTMRAYQIRNTEEQFSEVLPSHMNNEGPKLVVSRRFGMAVLLVFVSSDVVFMLPDEGAHEPVMSMDVPLIKTVRVHSSKRAEKQSSGVQANSYGSRAGAHGPKVSACVRFVKGKDQASPVRG